MVVLAITTGPSLHAATLLHTRFVAQRPTTEWNDERYSPSELGELAHIDDSTLSRKRRGPATVHAF